MLSVVQWDVLFVKGMHLSSKNAHLLNCFNILVQVQTSEQTFFDFLILGKFRSPPKSFITSTIERSLSPFCHSNTIQSLEKVKCKMAGCSVTRG